MDPHAASPSRWLRLVFAARLPRPGSPDHPATPATLAAATDEVVAAVKRQLGSAVPWETVLIGDLEASDADASRASQTDEVLARIGEALTHAHGVEQRATLFAGAGVATGAGASARTAAAALLVAHPDLPGPGARRRLAVAFSADCEPRAAIERATLAAGTAGNELTAVFSATTEPVARRREAEALTAWQPRLPVTWLVGRVGEVGPILGLLALLAALEEPEPQLVIVSRGTRAVVVALR